MTARDADPRDAQIAALREALEHCQSLFELMNRVGGQGYHMHDRIKVALDKIAAALAAAPLPEPAWDQRQIWKGNDGRSSVWLTKDGLIAFETVRGRIARTCEDWFDLTAAPLPAETEPPDYRAQNLGCPCNNNGLSLYCKDVGPCTAFRPAPTTEPGK